MDLLVLARIAFFGHPLPGARCARHVSRCKAPFLLCLKSIDQGIFAPLGYTFIHARSQCMRAAG
ncbi:hypothetical protein, partial [Achromobacter sp. AGC25]